MCSSSVVVKVLLSLKVVKFDTKMYLKFSHFWGQTSAGRGQALVQKRGQVSDGGLTTFLLDGGPLLPPRKNPVKAVYNYIDKDMF